LFRRQSSRIGGSYVDGFAVSGLRAGWHLIDGAPSIGSRANEPFEYRSKVSLRLEAHRQGDFDDWRRRVLQQFLSPQNSPPQNKLVRSQICRRPELRREVHSAQSCDGSQLSQGDFGRQMQVDIFDNPLEAPFLQRLDLPSPCRHFARLDGSPDVRQRPEKSDGNGKPQGVRKVLVVSLFRDLECARKRLDDMIIRILSWSGIP
jgi:hypothetical protein